MLCCDLFYGLRCDLIPSLGADPHTLVGEGVARVGGGEGVKGGGFVRCGGATGLLEVLSWAVGGGGAEHLIVGTFFFFGGSETGTSSIFLSWR